MFYEILKNLNKNPKVHCITNFVTINDVANIILASGGSPIMADAIEEVGEITGICDSLVLNMGDIHNRLESMIEAGKMANKLNKPVVFDPVAVGASKYRREACERLLKEIDFAVIRGNASEIKAMLKGTKTFGGVDVSEEDIINEGNLEYYIEIGKEVSKNHNSVVAITGPMDIITYGENTYIVRNGHETMEKVTGTGCMLTGLIGGFVGANPDNILNSTVLALGVMGLCGELAHSKMILEDLGIGSFRTFLIDYIYKIDEKILRGGLKIETRQ